MAILLIILSLSPIKDFRYAKGLFSDGLYDLAETELTDFLNKYPNSIYAPDASVLLVKSLNKQESFKKSIVRCRQFISKYPEKKEDILSEWGKAEIGISDYKSAIKVFGQLSNRNKREMWLGEVYFKMENFKEALNHYLKSNLSYSKLSAGWCWMKLENYSKASSTFSSITGDYEEEGKFMLATALFLMDDKNAEKAFDSYLKKFPEGRYGGRVYSYLADIYEKQGDLETAIQYLNNIPEVDPSLSGFAFYRIGLILHESGNYPQAIESFAKVKIDDPYYWDALYWKSLSEIKVSSFEDATENLKQVIENCKELSNEALFELGFLYKKTGKNEEALSTFREVKGNFQDEAGIMIGNILLEEEHLEEAYSEFLKVVDMEEGNASLALLQSSITKKKAGELEVSLDLLNSYEKKFPEGPEIYRVELLKGDIYLEQEKYREAIEAYDKIDKEKSPDLTPYILEGKAWAWMDLKRYDMAFLTLEKLSDQYPLFCSRPEIYLQMGNAAYAMGNLKAAEKAYLQVKGDYKPEALFLLGKMFFENKNYNEAIKVFTEIKNKFSLSKYSPMASYHIALSLRKKQDIRNSNKCLYSLVSELQDKEILTKSFLLLGDNYFDMAEYDSSLKYYSRGFDITTGKPKGKEVPPEELSAIRGILLSVNASSGSSAMEEKARDLIRKLKGTDIESWTNLLIGNILFNSGKYDRALDYLEESKSPTSLYQAGLAYLKLGRNQEATRFLKEAASSEEIKDRAFLELGRLELNSGNLEEAKQYLLLSSLPESSLLYAISLKKEGKEKEAMNILENLKGKVDGLAYLELGKTQMDLKMFNTALNNLKKAIGFERSAPESYYLMGKILLEQGKEDESFKTLLKVKYLYPESEWVSPSLFLLSTMTLQKGDTARATDYLKQIVERGNKDWTPEARKRLSELEK